MAVVFFRIPCSPKHTALVVLVLFHLGINVWLLQLSISDVLLVGSRPDLSVLAATPDRR